MRNQSLTWKLFLTYFSVAVVAIAGLTFMTAGILKKFYFHETTSALTAKARLVEEQIRPFLDQSNQESLQAKCDLLTKLSETRITVVGKAGTVLADTDEKTGQMENHADRPEIIKVMAGKIGISTRFSYTLHTNMIYLAIPHFSNSEVTHIIRVSIPTTEFSLALKSVYNQIYIFSALLALVVAIVSWLVAQYISRPLAAMQKGAEQFAQGELRHKLTVPSGKELGGLAQSMNAMAKQLDERFRLIARQHNELVTMLESMVEGVLAVDQNDKIININQSAAALFDKPIETIRGRKIQEVIRHPEILDFLNRILEADHTLEADLNFYQGEEDKIIRVQGSALIDESQKKIGALLVMHDITQQRRLENMRKEFVANVSHELKTPLTVIQGFVETLEDDEVRQPQKQKEFLGIINKHIKRLNTIIEDLMNLSRIEQSEFAFAIHMQTRALKPVLQTAMQIFTEQGKSKQYRLRLECPEDIQGRINQPLFEQAITNLIDNAIKYGNPEKEVVLRVVTKNGTVVIQVIDQGPGIPAVHLPRLFERFYRVDKARSRDMGGTGLGLAIVKHIAIAHQGWVEVESTEGVGSIFSIYLPAIQAAENSNYPGG
ncbi:HAMP domain-containing protein [bacterium]|nr:HAMP domain-containing protein [bacterium]